MWNYGLSSVKLVLHFSCATAILKIKEYPRRSDEPLKHMTELIVNENLKDMKITRITIAHRQETSDVCDRVFDLTNDG